MSLSTRPIQPLLSQLPIVDLQTGHATPAFQRIISTISAVIQNSGGLIDVVTSGAISASTPTPGSTNITEGLNIQNIVTQLSSLMSSVSDMQTAFQIYFSPPLSKEDIILNISSNIQNTNCQYQPITPRGYVPEVKFDNGQKIIAGVGDPNSLVYGSVGDLFLRKDGSASSTFYVKESGNNTNTGWVAK